MEGHCNWGPLGFSIRACAVLNLCKGKAVNRDILKFTDDVKLFSVVATFDNINVNYKKI